MVWFQCEECGENLKKPKLPNHFRICSARKLSCIDCGEMFSQQSVQGHTQCISEAEKYGPKDQAKSPHNMQQKTNKSKQNADIDVNVGLSSHAPWFCSLCNTSATSKQTLLLHADGKKHRAKARAYHNAQKQSSQKEESTQNKENIDVAANNDANDTKSTEDQGSLKEASATVAVVETESKKKRKLHASVDGDDARNEQNGHANNVSNGEVIQVNKAEADSQSLPKKKKCTNAVAANGHCTEENGQAEEAPKDKIKWKKLVTSILKSNSDGVLKIKKLQKLVLKALKESGISEDETQLREKLMDKIASSSRFVVENKYIRLASKGTANEDKKFWTKSEKSISLPMFEI